MLRKIIVCTTNGQSREDGNVFYSQYLLVETDKLKFDEPIFVSLDKGAFNDSDNVKAALENIGYSVTEPDIAFAVFEEEEEED